jgi:hypothetical protein
MEKTRMSHRSSPTRIVAPRASGREIFKKSAETEKNSKEKQNAKHKKGTFLNWFDTPNTPPLTLSAPLCYVETFLIEERKPPVAKP